eukprot:1365730-Pyramimonas_sp.AAC.1
MATLRPLPCLCASQRKTIDDLLGRARRRARSALRSPPNASQEKASMTRGKEPSTSKSRGNSRCFNAAAMRSDLALLIA